MKTIALIPAFNEERTIAKVIVGCEWYCDHIIVCDDGSKDDTGRIAKRLGAEVITQEHNQGKGAALQRLFQRAVEMKADIVITIDADGQHDTRDIPKFLKALKDYDIVIGSRRGIPKLRAIGNAALRGREEMDTESGFRAYKGARLAELIPSEDGMAADREIFQKAKSAGMAIGEVEIDADYSVPNPSKKNLVAHFLDVFLNGLKQTTIRTPSLLTIAGLVCLALGLWFARTSLPYLMTEGFGTVLLFILGFFLISTSILIWYLMNILKRAKR